MAGEVVNIHQALDRLEQELDLDWPTAVLRYEAHRALGIKLGQVDAHAAALRRLLTEVPGPAEGATEREVFAWALHLCCIVGALAGREDLAMAMHTGRLAVRELDRGFVEPLLRAARKADHRESLRVTRAKAIAADAYRTLRQLGVADGDAAEEVASAVVACGDKSVVSRSIKNWGKRLESGKLPSNVADAMIFIEALRPPLRAGARDLVVRALKAALRDLGN
jgi:hypothetical protein